MLVLCARDIHSKSIPPKTVYIRSLIPPEDSDEEMIIVKMHVSTDSHVETWSHNEPIRSMHSELAMWPL